MSRKGRDKARRERESYSCFVVCVAQMFRRSVSECDPGCNNCNRGSVSKTRRRMKQIRDKVQAKPKKKLGDVCRLE